MTDYTDREWAKNITEILKQKRRHKGDYLGPLQLRVSLPWLKIADMAADRRGLNRTSYVRRALSVHMAGDLGLPVHPILALLTPPRGRNDSTRKEKTFDDGTGIEDWCPHPGCDGAHLAPGAP